MTVQGVGMALPRVGHDVVMHLAWLRNGLPMPVGVRWARLLNMDCAVVRNALAMIWKGLGQGIGRLGGCCGMTWGIAV